LILNKVELRNFISHKSTSITFDLGVTAIVGPNGSGKTSILDAISYALFKVHSRGKEEYVVNRSEREASVRLSFSSGGRNYLVEWEIEKGKRTRARLYEEENGRRKLLAADGERTVVPEIERILEMDKDLFLQAVYVRQGEIEGLVAARPAERKRIMAKLLGIEDLEEAWENMKEVVDEHKTLLAKLEAEVKRLEEAEAKLRELEVSVTHAEKELAELRRKTEEARIKADGLKKLVEKMEEARAKDEELRNEKVRVESELALARADIKKMEEELRRIEVAERVLEEFRAGYEEYQELTKRLEQLRVEAGRLREVGRSLDIQRRRFEDLRSKLSEAEAKLRGKLAQYSEVLGVKVDSVEYLPPAKWDTLDRLRRNRASLEEVRERTLLEANNVRGRLNELQRLLEELSLSPNVCPVCGRELTDEHRSRLVNRLTKEIEELKVKSLEVERELARLDEEWRRLERLTIEVEQIDIEEVEGLVDQVEGLRVELRRIEEELQELREEEDRLKGTLEEASKCEEKLKELKKAYEKYLEAQGILKASPDRYTLERKLSVRRVEEEALRSKLRQLEEERSKLNYNPMLHEKLRAEAEGAERRAAELEKQAASKEAEAKNLRRFFEEKVKEVEELKVKERELKCRRSFVELLERIRRVYGKDGLQKVIRARARPLIERYTKEYLERFNLEYSDVKLDEDFNLTIVGPFGEQPIESISGGERVAIAIALRLAIARAVAGPKLELMMLDEPTIHLDEERRRELVEVLKKFFREGPRVLPQLILVTHDREVEEAADVVYVVSREAGYSKVKLETGYE